MKNLNEIIEQNGLTKTANKFGFHKNNIREMANRNAIVIDGNIYAPVRKRKSRKE